MAFQLHRFAEALFRSHAEEVLFLRPYRGADPWES